METGIGSYYYVEQMRKICSNLKQGEHKLNDENRNMYLNELENLKSIAPKDNHQNIDDMIKIVNKKV